MSETTPLIKAALNLRVGVGFDVYDRTGKNQSHGVHYRKNRGGFEGAFRAADL